MIQDRRTRARGPLALCLLLGACAANDPAGPPPPSVQSTTRANVALPEARGVVPVVVRAAAVEGGVARELAGATCDLASTYTTARFTAPATVSVPDLGASTPPLTVSCALGGRKGTGQILPATRVADSGLGGWPAIGVSIGAGSGGWSGTGVSIGGFWNGGSGDGYWTQVVYPDLTVTLR